MSCMLPTNSIMCHRDEIISNSFECVDHKFTASATDTTHIERSPDKSNTPVRKRTSWHVTKLLIN